MCAADAEMGWRRETKRSELIGGAEMDQRMREVIKIARLKMFTWTEHSRYLHVWGFQQQVAEWLVAGRWQHHVLDVGQLQAQRPQVIRFGLATVPLGLKKIPERSHQGGSLKAANFVSRVSKQIRG